MTDSDLLEALNDPDVLKNLNCNAASRHWRVHLHPERWSEELTAREAIEMAAAMAALNRQTAEAVK